MCRERKIFVKAALQLLESHERENFASVIVPAEATDDPKFDLIRSGFLWKGAKTSMARSGINGHHWKSKYVELRHGQFSYFDDEADESPLVVSSVHSYHVNFSAASSNKRGAHPSGGRAGLAAGNHHLVVGAKKVIPLSSETCVCRIVALEVGEAITARSPAPFFWQHNSSSNAGAPAVDPAGPGAAKLPHGAINAFTPTSSSGNLEALGTRSDGRCAFEVSVLGGQRRLFLASTAAECEAWVTAINIAMGGRKVGAGAAPQGRQLVDDTEDRNSTFSATNLGAEIAAPFVRRLSRNTHHLTSLLGAAAVQGEGTGALEGAAGPYARNIADYISWQEHLHLISEERDFRAAMRAFIDGPVCLSVPVAYVKGKCADSRFKSAQQSAEQSSLGDGAHAKHGGILAGSRHWLSAGHKKSHHAAAEGRRSSAVASRAAQKEAVCVEKSQMWKDLQRDEVSVNGERVCGTSGFRLASPPSAAASSQDQVGGAEAIIGVLVRHISDAADAAKSELVRLLKDRQECDPNTHPSIDAVQEAQIVQCARNVLMMCNRTQSGGDTYYCVDSLLNRARGGSAPGGADAQSSLFVLAPVSNSADPLEIAVDVVETARSNFFLDDWSDAIVTEVQDRAGAVHAASIAVPMDEAHMSTPGDAEQYRPGERVSANSEDFIEAIVASTNASPPAHQPSRESETHGRARQELLGVSDAGVARPKSGRVAAGVGTTKTALASPPGAAAPGRGSFARSSSIGNRSGRRFSAVSPQNAKAQDGAAVTLVHVRETDDRGTAATQDNFISTTMLENSALQRRGSGGRKSQLKLSIDDDESSNCDNDGSPVCRTHAGRGELKGYSGSIQASSVDDACDNSTNPGDREDCDADDEDTAKGFTGGAGIAFAAVSARGVPLSVMCLSDGEEEDGGGAGGGGQLAGTLTLAGHHFNKDDSTVISDITFDTTAGFSQSTTLAHYQRSQTGAVTPVAPHRGDGVDYVPMHGSVGKPHSTHKPKSLLKMIASRLTPKPGAAMTPTGAESSAAYSVAPSPQQQQHGVPSSQARALNNMNSPRFRGGAANTFLASSSADGGEQQHAENFRFGSYFSGGGAKKKVHLSSEQKHGAPPSEKVRAQNPHQPVPSGYGDQGLLTDGADNSDSMSAPSRPCLCVRLSVRGVSRYRVCSADPQGDPEEDNWATMVGTFRQTFLIPACIAGAQVGSAHDAEGPPAVGAFDRCRLALTDRVVSITAEKFCADL